MHLPKTGGMWMKHAVGSAGIPIWRPDPLWDQEYSPHGHAQLGDVTFDDRFSVAFVRHPLDWWRSYWGHRMREGWLMHEEIDATARSGDFNEFVTRAVTRFPGHVGDLVRRFVGYPSPQVDFVGRFEHLVDDTCTALRLGGEPFSETVIRTCPRVNANDYCLSPAMYRAEVAALVAEAEHETIAQFYPEDPIPSDLVEGELHLPGDVSENACSAASEYVRGLERAVHRAHDSNARLEAALLEVQRELTRTQATLGALSGSHLLRYTRPLRSSYYRLRPRRWFAKTR